MQSRRKKKVNCYSACVYPRSLLLASRLLANRLRDSQKKSRKQITSARGNRRFQLRNSIYAGDKCKNNESTRSVSLIRALKVRRKRPLDQNLQYSLQGIFTGKSSGQLVFQLNFAKNGYFAILNESSRECLFGITDARTKVHIQLLEYQRIDNKLIRRY